MTAELSPEQALGSNAATGGVVRLLWSVMSGSREASGSTAVLPDGYAVVMAVKKISIALDPEVAQAAASSAESHGQSLSSWLNDAARSRLALERGRQAVQQWQDERGAFTEEERASADALLDDLLDARRRHRA